VPENDSRQFFRDWGHHVGIVPWLAVRPEVGTVLGAGPEFHAYGFRRVPYETRMALRVATTTKAGELNADLAGDFRFERPDRRVSFRAIALNADVIRYFGLGNETPRAEESAFNNVLQKQYAFEPIVELGTGNALRYRIGGVVRWSKTQTDHPTLLAQDSAYGSGSFSEAGLVSGLEYDSRDDSELPTRGLRLELTGQVFPSALDVRSAFGSVGLVGATYLSSKTIAFAPVLALRAGGMRVWGSYPFFEAANIGSATSIRGLPIRRYAGDASLYASTELRLNLAGKRGNWGILGLADVGRVFLEGETSNRWHSGFGGGIWFELAELHRVITATLASSNARARFYLKTSFHF
jgi:outer membrane protein assembly factor BamA